MPQEGFKLAIHPFKPVYDEHSKVLILGSFPSRASLDGGFYYGDNTNRFWDCLPAIFNLDSLKKATPEEKKAFLLSHHIALWDIIKSCYKRKDSSKDSDIDHSTIEANDLNEILKVADIRAIFVVGKVLYEKIYKAHYDTPAIALISSSGSAKKSVQETTKNYKQILQYL